MIKKNKQIRHIHIKIGFCAGLSILFLGLVGCGCLLPDVPCVPGVCQYISRGLKK